MSVSDRFRVGVLASGSGTNLQALIDRFGGDRAVEVAAVASDQPEAGALVRAGRAGIETAVFPRADYPSRTERDAGMAAWLSERRLDLIVLAGYMQLLDATFLDHFPGAVINVHPALLPAFPGLDAIGQAVEHGAKMVGVTIHFVDEGMDTGPIIMQRALPLPYTRPVSEIESEIHAIEHRLLPEAVALMAAGKVRADPDNPRLVHVDE